MPANKPLWPYCATVSTGAHFPWGQWSPVTVLIPSAALLPFLSLSPILSHATEPTKSSGIPARRWSRLENVCGCPAGRPQLS